MLTFKFYIYNINKHTGYTNLHDILTLQYNKKVIIKLFIIHIYMDHVNKWPITYLIRYTYLINVRDLKIANYKKITVGIYSVYIKFNLILEVL